MNWSTSAHTTLSSDTEPSIVITFDSAKYIFNAGENTTRAILQSKRGWRRIKALFLTQLGTQRSSGVPGLCMSLADSSPRMMEIVGPRGLRHFLASMRFHVFRKTLGLISTEIPDYKAESLVEATPVFSDDNITVFSIPIVPTSHHRCEMPAESEALSNASENVLKRKRESSPELPSKRPLLGSTAPITDGLSTKSMSSTLLERFLADPLFDPAILEGDEADAWRQLIIDRMFTWMESPSLPSEHTNKKGKRERNVGDTETKTLEAHPSQAGLTSMPQVPHWAEGPEMCQEKPPGRGPREASPTGSLRPLPTFTPPVRDGSTAYIVVGPRNRGKFDVKRAKELGLYGPLRARIARGETVTFTVDDGTGAKVQRTVKPDDCIGEHETQRAVIILDVPTPDHIESLVSAFATPAYSPYRVKNRTYRNGCAVHVIYHLLGSNVLEDERYKSFMNGFSDDAQHLISSPDHGPDRLTFTSAGLSQLKLNQLDSEMFPLPHHRATPRKDISLVTRLPSQSSYMQPNSYVDIRPPRRVLVDPMLEEKDRFHPAMAANMLPELSLVTKEKFTEAKRTINSLAKPDDVLPDPGDELVVIPLGTSSAICTRYRNVSGHIVQIPDWGSLLLDAGEGTWGQMARYFGTDPAQSSNVWQALRDLKCIFISHAHADHHCGLAKILAMRKQLDPPPLDPLYLISISTIHLYLRELAHLEDLGLSDSTDTPNGVIPILSDVLLNARGIRQTEETGWRCFDHSRKAAQMLCQALGLDRLNTVDVLHRTKAFGLVATHQDGWRLVYSGDTMPSENLVQAGQGATLLIHEATMGDDEEEMAHAKAHSTISQAIDVAKQMRAQKVLLTHFSSRYPTMPRYSASSPKGDGAKHRPVIALAMDHACIHVGNLWKMATYFPAIEQSFKDMRDEVDEEGVMRASSGSTRQYDQVQ